MTREDPLLFRKEQQRIKSFFCQKHGSGLPAHSIPQTVGDGPLEYPGGVAVEGFQRGGGQTETLLEELEFCLPAGDHTAQEVESAETARSISAFLRSQPEQARNIFIRRYWYCDATADIAKRYGIGESKVRVTLHRMRTKLKAYLEKEGVCL